MKQIGLFCEEGRLLSSVLGSHTPLTQQKGHLETT